MTTLLPYINKFLALAVVSGQVLVVVAIVLFFVRGYKNHFLDFIHKHVLWIGFLIALLSTAFSLFYSDIIGYAPCNLCWLQRIFIYPQVILFGLALLKKDRKIIDYCFGLTIVGLVIAFYQNYLYLLPQGAAPCAAGDVSCTANYVSEFGYITIPMMTLTAFAMILATLLVDKLYKKSQ